MAGLGGIQESGIAGGQEVGEFRSQQGSHEFEVTGTKGMVAE